MKRRALLTGLLALQVLLMGSAFVGGRMIGEQNQRSARRSSPGQLPAQLPKDPAAGTGTVSKIQDNLITLAVGRGGPGGAAPASATEIAVGSETKYYKPVSSGGQGNPGMPGGSQTQLQVQDAALGDIKVGNNIMVWGTKNGQRITAEVIYIQSSGR